MSVNRDKLWDLAGTIVSYLALPVTLPWAMWVSRKKKDKDTRIKYK